MKNKQKRKNRNVEYEIEYEDAPSGNITFYNYKEPLMEYRDGFGYVGAIIFDGESDKIQCHICGEWFANLGRHIGPSHQITAYDYKEMVGLNQSTALINESTREKLIRKNMKKRKANLRPGGKKSKEVRAKISETLKRLNAEKKNLRNTCPAQLIERLQKQAREEGRTPYSKSVPFIAALCKTFGSYQESCKIAGIKARKPGQTERTAYKFSDNFEFTDKQFLKLIVDFVKREKRLPSFSDSRRGLFPYRKEYIERFGTWKKAVKLSGVKIIRHE